MRILIDTNIFISRENNYEIPEKLSRTFALMNKQEHVVFIHPKSIDEIKKDRDEKRRRISLSKINSYPIFEESKMLKKGEDFMSIIGKSDNPHDAVDDDLLLCIYKDALDFLISEDQGLHRKASKLGVDARVLYIEQAFEFFSGLENQDHVITPIEIDKRTISSLNLQDPIFDSLKKNYLGFEDWWRKISLQGRFAWVYDTDNGLGAILILKEEDEAILCDPPLVQKRRVKICTLKAAEPGRGQKLGELFLKIAFDYAMGLKIDEVYLTTFIDDNHMIPLIEEFGFIEAGNKGGEKVYTKKLQYEGQCDDPTQIFRQYYPSFYDGKNVRKFVIPIRPEFYKRLFIDDQPVQLNLKGFDEQMIVERNTIKKAYLSHSKIKPIQKSNVCRRGI